MRGAAPPSPDFTAWLRTVIGHRRLQTLEETQEAIRAGVQESSRHGTTLLGDISALGLSWASLEKAPLRSIVFFELLGLPAERAQAALAAAKEWLETHPATPTCRPGLSPHAPYSVRNSLFTDASRLAAFHHAPLATHLAETIDELELLRARRGPFVSFLNELGVWDPTGLGKSAGDIVDRCGDCQRKLFVHANYLNPEVRLPQDSMVIYCPRTHHAFGHARHPFRELVARGIRVALGTDSLASNPDLDVLAEARFIHRLYPDFSGQELLRMATLSGAEALGFADVAGSIEAGKSADLAVVPLPAGDGDPYELLFGLAEPVRGVMFRGKWIHPPA
jgi:cytosine/adenosine deaminase-related metal-dependent hydrolase